MDKDTVYLPKNYKPSEDEEYMNKQQLEYFRRKLLFWKESLENASEETVMRLKNTNLKEADLNDRASVESELNFELRTRDRYRKLMIKINAALRRIKRGTYGFCVKTFEPIGIKRLDARPIATFSINAQEEHERTEKTYSKE